MTYQIFPPFSGKIGAILSANKISPPILSASQGKKLPFIEVLLDFFQKIAVSKGRALAALRKGRNAFRGCFFCCKKHPRKIM